MAVPVFAIASMKDCCLELMDMVVSPLLWFVSVMRIFYHTSDLIQGLGPVFGVYFSKRSPVVVSLGGSGG